MNEMNESRFENQENAEDEINLQDIEQFLCFGIETELFAFELLSVNEILKPVFITRLANVADYIMGVINLRGEIIPIVDLRKRFGFGYVELKSSSRIIVVVSGKNDKKFGVLVDEVKQVLKIDKKDISESVDDIAIMNYYELVNSVSRFDGKLILNLSVDDMIEMTTGEGV